MHTEDEYLPPDDYGMLTRADAALKAAQDHYNYLIASLFRKHKIPPEGAIETDGRITRP